MDEDLDRGRQYVHQEDLKRFGVDLTDRRTDGPMRDLMRFEIDRCRELYRSADLGIDMLPASSARCIRAARTLYSGILDRIEAADYDVFRAAGSSADVAEGGDGGPLRGRPCRRLDHRTLRQVGLT
ncbi:MAG: squalene/phytoene synthase family protein [Ilumatobacteraceae bacterium]